MYMLEAKNLEKSFSKNNIIKKISFNIKQGEIVGFVGPNGAGKTTTLKLITNLIYPDNGEILINGYNLFKEREKALACLSAIVENPGLYTYLSGRDNMEYIRSIRHISKEKMNSIIEYTGLENRINDKVKRYSLGMKQRLALGMCLLSEPKLLLLDEPTNGLDPTGTIEFRELIISLAREKKMSILFSSHLLSEVEKVCDRVIFIKEGEIIAIKDNSKNKKAQTYKITTLESKKAKVLFEGNDNIYNISVAKEGEILINIKENSLGEVLKLLGANNVAFSDVEKKAYDMEEEYNEIYKENNKI